MAIDIGSIPKWIVAVALSVLVVFCLISWRWHISLCYQGRFAVWGVQRASNRGHAAARARPRLSWGRSSLYSLNQTSVSSRTYSMVSNT